MKIPVFVSAPTALAPAQEGSRLTIIKMLIEQGLEARALGRSDYPTEAPLREVLSIARRCSGGIILGFEQFRADSGIDKPGTTRERHVAVPLSFPTPWNQLEAGILFSLRLPLLVFREHSIEGGVFDLGASDLYLHPMPPAKMDGPLKESLRQVFQKWSAQVRKHYYND